MSGVRNLWEEPSGGLVERSGKGDEEALSEMMLRFTPLIRYIAREFKGSFLAEEDDLLQEGYISLIRAVRGYEANRGKFSSYLFSCVRNGMISYLRKNKNKNRESPLDPETEASGKGSLCWPVEELLPPDFTSLLTITEMTVLDAFLETGSVSSSAVVLGWQRKKVDNAMQRIRKKLRGWRDARAEA
ncbi:MAG TPA: sigma-70 family RNA polymerase sigma factor [Thermovirgaceae bacterium]|jgi:RNA polymerase sigma factor (sigma-70 family)|nr:sigma-70 family RNA polymerase sigma factor [Thermovirgaceae bacterium]